MNNLSQYIIEKLHLNKDIIKSRDISNEDDIKNVIREFLSDNNIDKYELTIEQDNNNDDHNDVLRIYIEFIKDQDNTKIHELGNDLFNKLYDEEKYKPYNKGTDWWISSGRKICFLFYKK